MTLKSKIGLHAIERAHHALEALPQHQPDELTKRQAVQNLLGPIRATRAKGYSLAAISKLFSECGIPITTGALRAYVSDASGAGGRKKRRPVKHGANTRRGGALATSKGNAKTATAQPAATPEQRDAAGQEHVDLEWEPTARSSNGSAARRSRRASGPGGPVTACELGRRMVTPPTADRLGGVYAQTARICLQAAAHTGAGSRQTAVLRARRRSAGKSSPPADFLQVTPIGGRDLRRPPVHRSAARSGHGGGGKGVCHAQGHR